MIPRQANDALGGRWYLWVSTMGAKGADLVITKYWDVRAVKYRQWLGEAKLKPA